jgi:hypothetical protein
MFITWESTSQYGVTISPGQAIISVSNYPNLSGGENPGFIECEVSSSQGLSCAGTATTPNYNVYVIGFYEEV